jgi:hypothetical protein
LFDFYVQNGIKEVGFNIEEIEGAEPVATAATSAVAIIEVLIFIFIAS